MVGIHHAAGLSTGDYEEAQVKRAMCINAAETVVLASQEKLGAASPYFIANVDAASRIIVDGQIAEARVAPFQKLGVTIIRAR